MNNDRAAIPNDPTKPPSSTKSRTHLTHNKMTMYENQRIQNLMDEELQQQATCWMEASTGPSGEKRRSHKAE